MIQKMLRKIFKASLRVIFLIIIGCLLGVYDGLRLSKEEEAEEKDSKSVIHVPFDTIKSSPDTNMAITSLPDTNMAIKSSPDTNMAMKSLPDTNMAITSLPDTNVATTPFTIDGSTSSFLTKQSFVTKQFTEELKESRTKETKTKESKTKETKTKESRTEESKTKESKTKESTLPVDRNTCSGGACNHGNEERSLDSIMAVSVSTGSHYSHSTGNRNKAASQFSTESFKEGQLVCKKDLPYLFRIDKINTNEAKEKCTLKFVTLCDTRVTTDLLVPCDDLELFQRDDLSKTDNTCPGDKRLLKDCIELSDGQRQMFDQLRSGKDKYIKSLEGMKTEILKNLDKNKLHNDNKKEAESFIKAYGTVDPGVYNSILDFFQQIFSSQDQNSIKKKVISSYDEAEEFANEALQTAVNPIILDELREENQMWNDKNPSIDTWVVWFSKYKFEVHSYHKGAKAMLYMLAMLLCLPSIAYFSGKFLRAVRDVCTDKSPPVTQRICRCICFCIAYAECFESDDQDSHGCCWKIWICVSKSLRCGCACCVAHVGLYSDWIVRAIRNEKTVEEIQLPGAILTRDDHGEPDNDIRRFLVKRFRVKPILNSLAPCLNDLARFLNSKIDDLKSNGFRLGCIFKKICPDGSSEIRCLYDILLCTIGCVTYTPLCFSFVLCKPNEDENDRQSDQTNPVTSRDSHGNDSPQPTRSDAKVQDNDEYKRRLFLIALSLKLGLFLFFVMLINFTYTYGP